MCITRGRKIHCLPPRSVSCYRQQGCETNADPSEGTQPLITNNPSANSVTDQFNEMADQSGERYQDFQTGATTGCSGQPCRACRKQQDHTMEHLYLLTMSCSHSTTLVLTSSYKCPHCSATSTASVQPLITNDHSAGSAADQLDEMADQSGERYQGYRTGATADCGGQPCRECRQQQDHTMKHLYLLTMSYNHTTTLVLTGSYKCPRCSATASGSIQVKGVKHAH
jgi:hypothetical protein